MMVVKGDNYTYLPSASPGLGFVAGDTPSVSHDSLLVAWVVHLGWDCTFGNPGYGVRLIYSQSFLIKINLQESLYNLCLLQPLRLIVTYVSLLQLDLRQND